MSTRYDSPADGDLPAANTNIALPDPFEGAFMRTFPGTTTPVDIRLAPFDKYWQTHLLEKIVGLLATIAGQ